jgi:hypothetical protein
MFEKIPQRNLPIFHISSFRILKGRTKILPLQRGKKENHLTLIARIMVTMMNIVGNNIHRRDRNSSMERGR